jgi:peptidoglycan hydrolase-like protein with peptidoglycan-binding domain
VSIARLQRRLKVLGIYEGGVTGDANRATTEAIRKYREGDLKDREVERLLDLRAMG